MPIFSNVKKNLSLILSVLIPLMLFWAMLFSRIPDTFSVYFNSYSLVLFLLVLVLFYSSFRVPGNYGILISLSLIMILTALPLSYKWTSGFSNNGLISGLLPYKDGQNYYFGANLTLNGYPLVNADQATQRPMFPGLLSSLLLFTDHNLMIVLGILVQWMGIGLFMSSRAILRAFGVYSASVYSTLLYFYMFRFEGFLMSEVIGIIVGCFAFVLLWYVSRNLKLSNLMLGLFVLMIGVSARAGAFFVFPFLLLWSGWIFRGSKRFSVRVAIYIFITILIGFLLVNVVYPRLAGIPPGYSFGNFSYAIYGQVHGGTGWHSAIRDLKTLDPSVVYKAAAHYFFAHPLSLFIGAMKSYRDFFSPGSVSIFIFTNQQTDWFNLMMWGLATVFLVIGLIRLRKMANVNLAFLLLAGFIGILLSIPFLPPVDGGSRFYASTIPFFFALPAIGVGHFSGLTEWTSSDDAELFWPQLSSMVIIFLMIFLPVLIYFLAKRPAFNLPVCPVNQKAFVIQKSQDSYVDLVAGSAKSCGFAPNICFTDFETNNTQMKIDDFYQKVDALVKSYGTVVEIVPAANLADGNFHFFLIPGNQLKDMGTPKLYSGCASEIKTQFQSIYFVESVTPGTR